MHTTLNYLAAMAACTLFDTSASAQSARDIRGPSPFTCLFGTFFCPHWEHFIR